MPPSFRSLGERPWLLAQRWQLGLEESWEPTEVRGLEGQMEHLVAGVGQGGKWWEERQAHAFFSKSTKRPQETQTTCSVQLL